MTGRDENERDAYARGWRRGDEVCRVPNADRDRALAMLVNAGELAQDAVRARWRDLQRALGERDRIAEWVRDGDVDPEPPR